MAITAIKSTNRENGKMLILRIKASYLSMLQIWTSIPILFFVSIWYLQNILEEMESECIYTKVNTNIIIEQEIGCLYC